MKYAFAVAGGTLAFALAAVTPSVGGDEKPAGAISAGQVAKDAEKYYGKTVTVHAEVEDVLDGKTITLDEDSLLAGPDVLVLLPAGVATTLTHDQKVTVTGKVRRYVVQELKKDYDWFDDGKLVDVKTKVDWKTRPVIIADEIKITAKDK
jgi:hypothetical protein